MKTLFIMLIMFIALVTAVNADDSQFAVDNADGTIMITYLDTQASDSVSGYMSTYSRGQECPASSGTYCTDQFPICCMVRGQWGCYASLSDCHE